MNVFLNAEKEAFKNALSFLDTREKILASIYRGHQEVILEKIKVTIFDIKNLSRNKYKIKRLEQMYADIDDQINKLMTKVPSSLKTGFVNMYEDAYYKNSFNIERVVNNVFYQGENSRIALNFTVLPTQAVEAALFDEIAGHTFKDRMKFDKSQLRWKLRTQVANAVIEGLPPRELAKRLKEIDRVFEMSKAKSMMTARTELLRAYSLGNEKAAEEAKKSGVQMDYVWDSSLKGNTRATHRSADGKKAKIVNGKPQFNINGVLLSSPRVTHPDNMVNSAGEVIHCRCRRSNRPFGFAPTKRVAKKSDGTWEEINGNITYKEWKKAA